MSAHRPLLGRAHALAGREVLLVYGSQSWVSSAAGEELRRRLESVGAGEAAPATAETAASLAPQAGPGAGHVSRPAGRVEVLEVEGAGHHVYADQPEAFHSILASLKRAPTS
jgi:pimeloyl-ACP methyl ester carboxylesterase